jgi:hypothetical protein
MLPTPKDTTEQVQKGNRNLVCPYCEDSPFIRLLTSENIVELNSLFDKTKKDIPILSSDGFIYTRSQNYNYKKGMFCGKCKTCWLWSNDDGYDCWDTYAGSDVPRIREVVIIGGKSYLNFLPIKDWETEEYMPLLHPESPLIKKKSK